MLALSTVCFRTQHQDSRASDITQEDGTRRQCTEPVRSFLLEQADVLAQDRVTICST